MDHPTTFVFTLPRVNGNHAISREAPPTATSPPLGDTDSAIFDNGPASSAPPTQAPIGPTVVPQQAPIGTGSSASIGSGRRDARDNSSTHTRSNVAPNAAATTAAGDADTKASAEATDAASAPSTQSTFAGRFGSGGIRSIRAALHRNFSLQNRRTNERIAEVPLSGEQEEAETASIAPAASMNSGSSSPILDRLNQSSTAYRSGGRQFMSSASLPIGPPSRGIDHDDGAHHHHRDSRSTIGSRLSFDFSPTTGSTDDRVSTAPTSTTGGGIADEQDAAIPTDTNGGRHSHQPSLAMSNGTGRSHQPKDVITIGSEQITSVEQLERYTQELADRVVRDFHTQASFTPVPENTMGHTSAAPSMHRTPSDRSSNWRLPTPAPGVPSSAFNGPQQLPFPSSGGPFADQQVHAPRVNGAPQQPLPFPTSGGHNPYQTRHQSLPGPFAPGTVPYGGSNGFASPLSTPGAMSHTSLTASLHGNNGPPQPLPFPTANGYPGPPVDRVLPSPGGHRSALSGAYNDFPFAVGTPLALPTPALVSSASSPMVPTTSQFHRGSTASMTSASRNFAAKADSNKSSKLPRYNFVLTGTRDAAQAARSKVLREHPFRSQLSLTVSRETLFWENSPRSSPLLDGSAPAHVNSQTILKPQVYANLEGLTASTGTMVTITGINDVRGASLGHDLESEPQVEIVITGPLYAVEHVRTRIMVMVDEVEGSTSAIFNFPSEAHNIFAGRKREAIANIQRETGTNIYFPLPLSLLLARDVAIEPFARLQHQIWITGPQRNVQRAGEMLLATAQAMAQNVPSRQVPLVGRKADWLLTDHLDDLRQIMIDNATYIRMPPLGTPMVTMTVLGNVSAIERSIRAIMQLLTHHFASSIFLLPSMHRAGTLHFPEPDEVGYALKDVANISGAEVVYSGNLFEISGAENEVKTAVAKVLELPFVQQFDTDLRFHLELALSERDFLQGRKNGKINKIVKNCNVGINFDQINDYNFMITLSAGSGKNAMDGLTELQEELPAEISFHVPEEYHKRCIGVGGKQIQRIMKKHGVYVKFSNADEFDRMGGYQENEDNVVARCPAKNAIELDQFKTGIMDMITARDRDYTTETVSIDRRYHRELFSKKARWIHDIQAQTSCTIRRPPQETASDTITIFGPESQIPTASTMLLAHVPYVAYFRLPSNNDRGAVETAFSGKDLQQLQERLVVDYAITVSSPVQMGSHNNGQGDLFLRLSLSSHNKDFLSSATSQIYRYLHDHNLNAGTAHGDDARVRADSFTQALPHFASRLSISTTSSEVLPTTTSNNIAAPMGVAATRQHQGQPSSPHQDRFNAGGGGGVGGNGGGDAANLRGAVSSPALRAIFDGPVRGVVR